MKKIQISTVLAETPEEAIKISKKGHKYFDFVNCEQVKCFQVTAVIETKEETQEIEFSNQP